MAPRAIALILACAASAATLEAHAIGFGRITASAVLGQRLDLPVPFHLDPGEHMAPECVSAEVTAGEARLTRDRVRVRLEPAHGAAAGTDWVARVTSDTAIQEPVIELVLEVGCERRFSRRFVVFADPPLAATAPPDAPPPLAAAPARAPVQAAEAGRAAQAAPGARQPRATGVTAQRHTEERAPVKARRTTRGATPASAPVGAGRAGTGGTLPGGTGARLLLDAVGPRLKLDIEDPVPMAPAAGEATAGAAAVEPAPEAGRLQQLETTLAQLRRETRTEREATGALKARLAEAELGSRAVPWLVSLLVITLLVAAWLALRLRRHQDDAARAPQWWASEPAAAAEPPVGPPEGSTPELATPDEAGISIDMSPTAPLPAALALEPDLALLHEAEPPYERTTVIPGPAPRANPSAPASEPAAEREVTVEELLDLEQQADFFIALGQEDAAIDLLMSHLRSTGGLSPLPYTKLLEICRRKDDREAYERIRARFNRRFNAYAPEWDAGPLSGRTLEDYSDVVQHLQALWLDPLDAMAVLEAMLFRKDTAHELFDLPAYKDVLLLYAVARDLWQQGAARRPAIDVLLPLGGQAPDGAAEAATH